ncbi:MAG TPA: hypothetical protein VFN35_03880 [Ktedonobacteraceae bacterium]|nr:hypothetical protein [Ktedonobacteraceae bacterium]
MKNSPELLKTNNFMWRTARLLDQHRFAYLFADGDAEAVREALLPYQNPDGGFGHGLEADIRGPLSQPMPTWMALIILDEINALRGDDRIVARACDYLLTITDSEGGVPFVLPSAMDYPHAPWWEVEGGPVPASLNPTACIAALLHKNQIEHPWLAPATEFCWRKLDELEESSPYEMRAILPFLDFVADRQRAEKVFAHIGPKILEQKMVALKPTTEEDTHSPLDYASRPESLARRLFSDEVIQENLDALEAAQQEDGGWPISWFAWNQASVLEARGAVTINALAALRAYGRID